MGCHDAVEDTVKHFRKIKLIEIQYNNINRGGNAILVMTDVMILGITSLYSVIALHNVLPLPVLALNIVVAVSSVILAQVAMYRAAADVNTVRCLTTQEKCVPYLWSCLTISSFYISGSILEKWRHNRYIQCNPYLKRLTSSCAVLKIMVGRSGNFMDRTTPLVTSQMTLEQTASLLLMTDQSKLNLQG
jgi:hypothetical protein